MAQDSENSILCVGLVCIDNFNILDEYPIEDSDQPAKEIYRARGGNAANNCTALTQILPKNSVTFLGIFQSYLLLM